MCPTSIGHFDFPGWKSNTKKEKLKKNPFTHNFEIKYVKKSKSHTHTVNINSPAVFSRCYYIENSGSNFGFNFRGTGERKGAEGGGIEIFKEN